MSHSIFPRQGDLVAVIRSEGENKDEMYMSEYPLIDDPSVDVVVGRVTANSWFEDYNSLISECMSLGLSFTITEGACSISVPEGSRLVGMEGNTYVGDSFADVFSQLMSDMQKMFTVPTELSGRVFAQMSIVIPIEDLGRFIGSLLSVDGGVVMMDEERDDDD